MATTPGMIPIGAAPKVVNDPNMALQQVQLQRRMALAQMLQQNAQEAGNAYSSMNGMRVVPRVGLAPAISQIANTLLGGYEQKKAYGDQAAMSQQQYANIASLMGGGAGTQGSVGGSTDGSSGSAAPTQSNGSSAMNPWGLDPGVATRLYFQDPQEYSKQLLQYHQPTDSIKNNQWMGLDPGTALAQEKAEANVKGTGSYSPNSTIVMPNGQMSVAPDFTNGRYGGFTPEGQPIMGQIQGSGVIAQQAGDTMHAQEANKILSGVTMANGAVVPMWAGQAAAGGGAPQGGGQAPPAQSTLDGINKQASDFVNKGYMNQDQAQKWLMDQYQSNGMKPTGDLSPATPQTLPAPVPQAQGSTGIGQSTQDKAVAEQRAKNIGDMEAKINQDAAAAIEQRQLNNKMVEHLNGLTTGPFAQHVTDAKNFLHQLGWSGADPTNQQEFTKYATQAALAKAKAINPSRPTNADLTIAIQSNPNQDYTTQAISNLIDTQNEVADNNIRKQTVYNKYRTQQGDPLQFEGYFSQNYPALGVQAPTSVAPGASTQAPKPSISGVPQAGHTESGYRFNGGDPGNKANWEKI